MNASELAGDILEEEDDDDTRVVDATNHRGSHDVANKASVVAATTAVSGPLRRRLSLRPANPTAGHRRSYHSLARSASLTVTDFTSQWCEVFRMFDVNLDGVVSSDELGGKMRSLGCNVTQSEVEDLVHEWDKDEKGSLSLTEFTLMMNSCRFQTTAHLSSPCDGASAADPVAADTWEMLELKAAFDLFDRDKNGLLDSDEVKTALILMGETLTDKDVEYIVAEADTDKDGAVSFREFCNVVLGRSLSPRSPFYFHGRSSAERRREEEERRVRMEYQTDHATMRKT